MRAIPRASMTCAARSPAFAGRLLRRCRKARQQLVKGDRVVADPDAGRVVDGVGHRRADAAEDGAPLRIELDMHRPCIPGIAMFPLAGRTPAGTAPALVHRPNSSPRQADTKVTGADRLRAMSACEAYSGRLTQIGRQTNSPLAPRECSRTHPRAGCPGSRRATRRSVELAPSFVWRCEC